MDIFGPTHTELRLFLKKYVRMEMEDVVDITIIRLENIINPWSTNFYIDGVETKSPLVWFIEVACRDGLRGESGYVNLRNILSKYISLFGEEPHQIKLSRVFIVDEVHDYRTTE